VTVAKRNLDESVTRIFSAAMHQIGAERLKPLHQMAESAETKESLLEQGLIYYFSWAICARSNEDPFLDSMTATLLPTTRFRAVAPPDPDQQACQPDVALSPESWQLFAKRAALG
jgi:hypothetical protein